MTISTDVFKAIKTRWAAAGTLSGIAGPYRGSAPSTPAGGPAFPYCIFQSIANTRRLRSNASQYWDLIFRFRIYAATDAAVEAALDLIGNAFDPATLTLDAGKGAVIQLGRESEGFSSTDDKAVPTGWIQYRATRSKAKIT